MDEGYADHPLVNADAVERRLYQEVIVGTGVAHNSLVVLPTGLGKTIIAALIAAHRLHKYTKSKCVFLAPTRPLVLQHHRTFSKILDVPENELVAFTGSIKPLKRIELWKEGRVIFMTPQILENDLIVGRYPIEDVSLIVFDEAHRAIGNYPYPFIAEQYVKHAKNPRILGLTASPGSSETKIKEVCRNLFIENVEVRTEKDSDVAPYVVPIKLDWEIVDLPHEFSIIKKELEELLRERLKLLKDQGFIKSYDVKKVSRKDLIGLRARIQEELDEHDNPPSSHFLAISATVAAIRLSYALELLETQGLTALDKYIKKMEQESKRPGAPKAIRTILENPIMSEIRIRLWDLIQQGIEHPKISSISELVSEWVAKKPDSRIIIFTQFRESARVLKEKLSKLDNLEVVRFVGQASRMNDKGISQKDQTKILQKFRSGEINVLVATSVAEEGLDISECDLVVFYDCVPSSIRAIQRRGRTGRRMLGHVCILITRGTRDEAYYWSAFHKERKMHGLLRGMKKTSRELSRERGEQPPLERFIRDGMTETRLNIVADHREMNSPVVKELVRLGIGIRTAQLAVADYVISEDVVVERKTTEDFLQSLVDQRLFQQLKDMLREYEGALLIIEGEKLYGLRAISPNAIRGALASIAVDFRIPILWAKTPTETARLLLAIAQREQIEKDREISIKGEKAPLTISEQQEYLLSRLPGINRKLATRLLVYFGSPEGIFSASIEELQEVHGIGKKIAEKIHQILTSKYTEESS
ncbi:MAG: DEAD/DEAH box helicase [Promethearchaeota archaeon]